jgi:hypothetical protein
MRVERMGSPVFHQIAARRTRPRDRCMGEFMCHERGKKEDCRQDRRAPNDGARPLRVRRLKMSGKREGDQERENDPAIVKADVDPGNAHEFHLRVHE